MRMFNPFVADVDILLYVKSQVEDVKGGTWLVDEGGFWTLKWHFAAKLREDLQAPGGLVSPSLHFLHRAGPGNHLLPRAAGSQE